MSKSFIKRTVGLFGSAVCEGQTKTGTELAPRSMREGGLSSVLYNLNWQVIDHGDISKKSVKDVFTQPRNQFNNS